MAQRFGVFVVGIGPGHFRVDVASSMDPEFLETTVLELKKKIYDVKGDIKPEYMRLMFAGEQMENEKTLKDYNIQKNSTVHVVTRVIGGSNLERVPVPPESIEDRVHKPWAARQIQLELSTTARDEIFGEEADKNTPPRVQMSCGHYVDPSALTQYCRNLIADKKFELVCPAVVGKKANGSNKGCDKIWKYHEVRVKALLTEAECMYFESKLTEHAAASYLDLKECPWCQTTIERQDMTNLRVICPICTKQGKSNFCWQCLKAWSGPTTSGVKCGDPDCVHPDLAAIKNCPMKPVIRDAPDVLVPIRRACPTCGKVVEHALQGCKNITCPRCKKEFCFACLKLTEECQKLKSGSWYKLCANPVAPRQTEIPVWSRHQN